MPDEDLKPLLARRAVAFDPSWLPVKQAYQVLVIGINAIKAAKWDIIAVATLRALRLSMLEFVISFTVIFNRNVKLIK